MPRSHKTHRRSAKAEAPVKYVKGIIQLTRKATGYLPWSIDEKNPRRDADAADIEIRTENLGGALNGDEVEVKLTGLFPRQRGTVTKVLSRAKTEFVGTIQGKG